jgi:hypothetical protein
VAASVPAPLPFLSLHGDAEARLLADAVVTLQAVMPHREIVWTSAWSPRVDMLGADAPPPPVALREREILPDLDPRDLLGLPQRMVLLSLLPSVAVPALRHRSGGCFLAHAGLRARWSDAQSAAVAAECVEVAPLSPEEAAAALEPTIQRLQEAGAAVVVCTAFRHVAEPLAHRRAPGRPSLRELVRRVNLETARLSQRTGCFVLDVDRPLAQEGGRALGVDCFGGDGRAAELAADELLGLVFDALPEDTMPTGET